MAVPHRGEGWGHTKPLVKAAHQEPNTALLLGHMHWQCHRAHVPADSNSLRKLSTKIDRKLVVGQKTISKSPHNFQEGFLWLAVSMYASIKYQRT